MTGKSDFPNKELQASDGRIMKLKNNLREVLVRKGMTASDLARLSKVPKTTISDWLAGSSPKNISQLKLIADVLNLSLDELVFGENSKLRKKSIVEEFVENEIYAGKYEVVLRKIIK